MNDQDQAIVLRDGRRLPIVEPPPADVYDDPDALAEWQRANLPTTNPVTTERTAMTRSYETTNDGTNFTEVTLCDIHVGRHDPNTHTSTFPHCDQDATLLNVILPAATTDTTPHPPRQRLCTPHPPRHHRRPHPTRLTRMAPTNPTARPYGRAVWACRHTHSRGLVGAAR